MIVEKAKCVLKVRGFPKFLWAEAVATAVYLLNMSPTKLVHRKTPFEAWFGFRPSATHLKIFGCIAYAHIPVEKRRKLNDKNKKFIFIGYSNETKGYRLYNPLTKKLTISRDVIFDEKAAWEWKESDIATPKFVRIDDRLEVEVPTATYDRILPYDGSSEQSSDSSNAQNISRRFRNLTDVYESCQLSCFVVEPVSFEEASKHIEWRQAMEVEMTMINKNQTWELVNLPAGKHAIGLK